MLDQFFNAAEAEARIYKDWEAEGCFKPSGDTSAEAYAIVIPPPNVTGVLHMGHALNNTLQDVLIRYHRMTGKNVLWQPGTDHAGIATQMVVERQMAAAGGNESRASLGRDAFVEKVWAWKEESGGQIVEQLKRLGASCDWSRLKFTMGDHGDPDNQMVEAVRKVFVDLYNEGLIYRDKRLVNWDPHFQTAISDLEVEPKEVKGHYWHLRYPLAPDENGNPVTYEHPVFDEEGEPAGTETRDYIVVATSRPETMLGDTGVAVHPDDERYKDLVGKHVILPIVGRRIPIVVDEYPDPEKGSGAVKITPAHDFNDYDVGKRCGLEVMNILTSIAVIVDGDEAETAAIPADYRGLDRFDARKKVVAHFEEHDLMQEIESLKIEQPFGDRSGVVIEPWLTDQWYVNAKELAKDAIRAVKDGKTRFVPENWEKTYFNWMEDIQPWCVSRQLWWGHRIPVWYGPNGEVYCAMSEAEAQGQAGEGVSLTQDNDVLDTWFSSALWPFSTQGWPNETEDLKTFYPGAVLVTAFDIIFFWVARMMMQGLKFMGEVPFKDVYIHALVLDEKGQKMSKSKGNVMDPLDLINEYGADALRFSMAAQAAQGRNIRLSKQRIEGYRNFSTKLWNAAKFCQMNECANWEGGLDPVRLKQPVNQWIVGEIARANAGVVEAIEAYRFNEAADAAYRFIWNVFCDWYLELIKPLLNGEDADAKAETRRVAGWVLDEILKLLHPFMPFVTEELWQQLSVDGPKRDDMLMRQSWSALGDGFQNADADAEMQWVLDFISEIRSLRGDLNVPAGAKPLLSIVDANTETQQRLTRHKSVLTRLARLDDILVEDSPPEGTVSTVLGEAVLALGVADLIDLSAEKARLEKEIGKLQKDIAGVDKKLANEKFMANAPPEIIEEQHTRRGDWTAKADKLAGALEQLSSLTS
ncbi:MAG: valine--tRNA ligase [Pseudomonadota bacterium]